MKLLLLLLFFLCCTLLDALLHCGLRGQSFSRDKRAIIGGRTVETAGRWPWQVLLYSKLSDEETAWMCGGTIISENWILTAAHCIRPPNSTKDPNVFIFAGLADFNLVKNAAVTQKATKAIVHENYTATVISEDRISTNDIALAKLSVPLKFGYNSILSPICLTNRAQDFPYNKTAVVSGFGDSNKKGTNETWTDGKLREAEITFIDQGACLKEMIYRFLQENKTVPDSLANDWYKAKLVCGTSLGNGAHKGDSGGPIMMKATDGRWFQLGIASFADVRQTTEKDVSLNAFTDVRVYCDWIENNTGGEAKCRDEKVHFQDYEMSS